MASITSDQLSAPKPPPTVPVQKFGGLPSPAKRVFKPGMDPSAMVSHKILMQMQEMEH